MIKVKQDGEQTLTAGDPYELTPKRVRAMTPEQRAEADAIFGAELVAAIAADDTPPEQRGSYTIASVGSAGESFVLERKR